MAGCVALTLAGLGAMVVSLSPHDLWWQTRAGEIIARTHRIPTADPFSWTARGEPWLVQEWLSGLLFYTLQNRLGWDSLVALQFALMAVTYAATVGASRARGASVLLSFGGATLAMWAIRPWLALRPQLFTYALFAATLALMDMARRRPALLLAWIPVTALWANMHAGALISPVMMGVAAAGSGADNLRDWLRAERGEPVRPRWSQTLWLGGATGATALATLLTPHGLALWAYPGRVTGRPIVTDFITEWQSPDFHLSGLVMAVLVFWVTLAAFTWSGFRPPLRDFLFFGAFLSLAMLHKRNVPFFALSAVPMAAGRIHACLEERGWAGLTRTAWAGALALLLSLQPMAQSLSSWPKHGWFASQANLEVFPVAAVTWLPKHPPSGPLFNLYQWGGYLIWRARDIPVFIDGRAEVYYRKGAFDDYVRVSRLQPGWRETLDRRGVKAVLMEPWSPLAQALALDPQWNVVYRDRQAVLLERG